jgi:two-component system, NtrC family, sensor histidine kinase KinB
MQAALYRLQVAELKGDARPALAGSREEFTEWMAVENHSLNVVGEAEIAHDLRAHAKRLFASISASPPGSHHNEKFEYLQDHLTDLVEMNEQVMYQYQQRALRLSYRLMLTFVAGLVAASVLGVFLSSILGKAIVRPLTELSQHLHGVGERKTKVRLGSQKLTELDAVSHEFNQMTERLEYYEQINVERLVMEKLKTEAMIESLEDGLILIDSAGLVAHMNEIASIIIGIERHEALGKKFDDVGDDHPQYVRVLDALHRLELNANASPVELELYIRGRNHYYMIKTLNLIPEDKPIGRLVILQDVTYLRDQDRARLNLFATLSHELRTPLTAMLIATQTLSRQNDSLSTSQRRLTEILMEETAHMNELTDNLMNLVRGSIPEIPTQRVRVELAELITETVERFVKQAREKHVSFETRVKGELVINADKTELSWIISNLIGNALRHTPDGGTIDIAAYYEGNNFVRLEVADTGPGIPPEIQNRVFERFAQCRSSGYEPGSAGLGLMIVKSIIEAHGGIITIESGQPNGTRFIVQLPTFKTV